MTVDATDAFIAALEATLLRPAFLVSMQFASSTVNAWTGTGTLSWNGMNFAGVGTLGEVAAVEEGSSVQARGTTLTLSLPAVSTGTLKNLAFVRSAAGPADLDNSGILYVPRRGVLQVYPGDVVARDSTGWPILVSANSIGFAGSDWTYT